MRMRKRIHTAIALPMALALVASPLLGTTAIGAEVGEGRAQSALSAEVANLAAEEGIVLDGSSMYVSGNADAHDVEAIIAALDDPGATWVSNLVKYLEGEYVSDSAFLAIDAKAVAKADQKLADEIARKQEAITKLDWVIEQPEPDDAKGDKAQDKKPSSGDRPAATQQPQAQSPAQDATQQGSVSQAPAMSSPVTVGYSLTTRKFIAVIGEQAREVAQENDLYASVMIAQGILESASGNSKLSKAPYNNIFGIKGKYHGNSVSMKTNEDDGFGNIYSITASFRSYPTMRESLEDYVNILDQDFYAGAHKSNTRSYVDACKSLQGVYATDTQYAEKLIAYIEEYDLTRFDKPLDYELVDTYMAQATNPVTGKPAVDPATGSPIMEKRTLADLAAEATSHLGDPYVWGGTMPGAFDCSGFVQYSYRKGLGVSLPRVADDQYDVGVPVDTDDLHVGDLLYFQGKDGTMTHVAMYLGEGCYIEAPHPGDVVKVTSFEEKAPSYAKRVILTRDVSNYGATMPMDYEEMMVYRSFLGI